MKTSPKFLVSSTKHANADEFFTLFMKKSLFHCTALARLLAISIPVPLSSVCSCNHYVVLEDWRSAEGSFFLQPRKVPPSPNQAQAKKYESLKTSSKKSHPKLNQPWWCICDQWLLFLCLRRAWAGQAAEGGKERLDRGAKSKKPSERGREQTSKGDDSLKKSRGCSEIATRQIKCRVDVSPGGKDQHRKRRNGQG